MSLELIVAAGSIGDALIAPAQAGAEAWRSAAAKAEVATAMNGPILRAVARGEVVSGTPAGLQAADLIDSILTTLGTMSEDGTIATLLDTVTFLQSIAYDGDKTAVLQAARDFLREGKQPDAAALQALSNL